MHDIVYCISISLATCIIMAALTPITSGQRTQQHTDLECRAVAHLKERAFWILALSWCVCYLQLLINIVEKK